VRAPLARIANQVFLNLTEELQNQGVRKKVIADMFGMALRTYHRRVRELATSRTEEGRTLWEVVLAFLREAEPVSVTRVLGRFSHDDPEVVTGILNDLVGYKIRRAQLCYFSDFSATLEEEGVSPGLFGLMAIVHTNPGLTQTAIAKALGNDRSAMVPAIDKLEKLNLVERRVSDSDKRSYSLYLSSQGEAKYRRMVKKIHVHESHFDALMTAKEKTLLLDILGRLADAYEKKD